MANTKNIANAFLDGFSSLNTLFEPVERPGSRNNLISSATVAEFTPEELRSRGTNLKELASRLRRSADLIESSGDILRQAAVKEAKPAHGVQ